MRLTVVGSGDILPARPLKEEAVNDTEKTALTAKVGELEAKQKQLETKLRGMEKFHQDAWNEYGSELCAGEMQGKESTLQKEIDECEREAEAIDEAIHRNLDLSDAAVAALREQAEGESRIAAEHQAKSKDFIDEAAKLERLRAYLK